MEDIATYLLHQRRHWLRMHGHLPGAPCPCRRTTPPNALLNSFSPVVAVAVASCPRSARRVQPRARQPDASDDEFSLSFDGNLRTRVLLRGKPRSLPFRPARLFWWATAPSMNLHLRLAYRRGFPDPHHGTAVARRRRHFRGGREEARRGQRFSANTRAAPCKVRYRNNGRRQRNSTSPGGATLRTNCRCTRRFLEFSGAQPTRTAATGCSP